MRARSVERYGSAVEVLAELRSLSSGTLPAAFVRDAGDSGSLWWWRFHQAAVAAVNAAMPVIAWAIRQWTGSFGSLIFLVVLALATISVTLRLNLVFTSRVHGTMLIEQHRRLRRPIAATDAMLALLLFGSAVNLAWTHDEVAALLVGLAVVTLASLAVIEPATTRAALTIDH